MVSTMTSIEYNFMKTLIYMLSTKLPSMLSSYNIGDYIDVLPAYPSNLTDIKKPSIIIRKVDTNQSKIGLGNVLGQFWNTEINGYSDVVGKLHDFLIQIDILTDNNGSRMMLESIIADNIFNMIAYENQGKFALYDFTNGDNNKHPVGVVNLIGDPMIKDVIDKDSANDYYVGTIRHNFRILQTIVPHQEYVDLSKWIKQTYRIILDKEE